MKTEPTTATAIANRLKHTKTIGMAMLEEGHRWFNSLPKPHLTWAEYQRCLSMDAYEAQVFLAGKSFRQVGIPHTSSMLEWPDVVLGRKD